MNLTRIQTNFLKMLMNEESVYVLKEEIPKMVGITEGHAVYFIPECAFFLDRTKMKPVDLHGIVDDMKKAIPSERTGVERKDKMSRNRNVIEIKHDDVSVWLDEKFCKDFDKFADYSATNEKSPVYVKENGQLVGIVLPVRIT